MTQPTVIFFGPDLPRSHDDAPPPKVFLRTLLFSTSKRGRVIESIHVAPSRNETHQNFNIWVYGDDKLVRGSGLFVGENGVAANHHFLTPKDGSSFRFTEGRSLRSSHTCSEIKVARCCSLEPLRSHATLLLNWKSRPPACTLIGGRTLRVTSRTPIPRSVHFPLSDDNRASRHCALGRHRVTPASFLAHLPRCTVRASTVRSSSPATRRTAWLSGASRPSCCCG